MSTFAGDAWWLKTDAGVLEGLRKPDSSLYPMPATQLTDGQIAALAGLNNNPPSLAASVQPRSNTLANLQNLAGLPGEWSYPTDYPDAMVRHTGVAGQAQTFWINGGAILDVDVTGLDTWTAPAGVSIASLHLTGSPTGNFVDVVLDAKQDYQIFTIFNEMNSNLDTAAEDSSSGQVLNNQYRAFLRIAQTGGGLLMTPLTAGGTP